MIEATCPICGITFGLPPDRHDYLRIHGGSFYCPNGHHVHFEDSRVKRLNQEIDALRKELSEQRNFTRELRLEFARYRVRIHAGVCPYCRRSFKVLARHIRSKHPQKPTKQ